MWLAHFSNHLVAGWSTLIPAVERFFSRVSSGVYPQAWMPSWIPSLELLFLDLGLLLTLYIAWRVARQVADGERMALAVMSPWAVLAGALYSAGLWIVFQPMQMRGTMMMRLGAIMTHLKLLLPFVAILAPALSFADGGTVQLRKEAGALVITVFTSPAPLSAGPVDISLLLQNAEWARTGAGCQCLVAAPHRRFGH